MGGPREPAECAATYVSSQRSGPPAVQAEPLAANTAAESGEEGAGGRLKAGCVPAKWALNTWLPTQGGGLGRDGDAGMLTLYPEGGRQWARDQPGGDIPWLADHTPGCTGIPSRQLQDTGRREFQ